MTGSPPRSPLPPALATLRLLARPTTLLEHLHDRAGDTFLFELAGVPATVMITRPQDVKAVFTAPREDVRNVAGASALGPLLGPNSVLTLDGDAHLRQRRLLSPPFRGERLSRWGPVVEQLTHARIDRWHPGCELRLQDEMQAITFDTILAIIFGMRDAARRDALRRIVLELTDRATSGPRSVADLVLAARRRQTPRMRRITRELDRLVYEEIAHHRALDDLQEREDVLSMLLLARDEGGRGLTDCELRDELVTLLLVGHETTATSLAWAAERLVRAPHALARLHDELDGPDGGAAYVEAVVHETLRDRPVVPLIGRELRRPLTLDGYEIAAGQTVNVAIWLVNHRADVYDEPHVFRPERFVGVRPDTYAWIPFGGGVRRCLGAAFAEMEMRHVLRVLHRRVRMSAVEQAPERPVLRSVTLAPRYGARVRVDAVEGRRRADTPRSSPALA